MWKKCLLIGAMLLQLWQVDAQTAIVAELDSAKYKTGDALPEGWSLYATGPGEARADGGGVGFVAHDGQTALRIADDSDQCEYGISHTFAVEPERFYRVTIHYLPTERWVNGVLTLSARFLPGQTRQNISPSANGTATLLVDAIPEGTASLRVSVFTNRQRKTELLLSSFKIESSDQPFAPKKQTTQPRGKFGLAKIGPRNLEIDTFLVRDGKAAASIVIPDQDGFRRLAASVNAAILAKCGVELPVELDRSWRHKSHLDRNHILLGNRDRNLAVSNLYNRHFTLLDSQYPGPGGNELRSLHDPFGDGHNIIFAGGSLPEDDHAAAAKLIAEIAKQPAAPNLKLGFLAGVTLSPEYQGKIARDVRDIPLWEQSFGYGGRGYFGWNSLAKNLAMLYITNDKYYADEFLRLAFPKDEKTYQELRDRDDESFKVDITDPIKSVYHYRGVMTILYWAMVEANPHFSDADREKVNKAFYRQLVFTLTKNEAGNLYRSYDKPGFFPTGRHASWEAVGAYAAGRFFAAHYPCFDADEALRLSKNALGSALERFTPGNIARYWHQTLLEPLFVYAALSGGLDQVGSPVLREYGKSLILMSDFSQVPGYCSDRMMWFSSLFMLNLFGYFCQDEAFSELTRRMPEQQSIFRLGQSFAPVAPYADDMVRDTARKWTFFQTMPDLLPVKPSFAPEKVMQAISYREKADATGDYLLLDPRYAPGLRETAHAFSILNFLLQGIPVLRGHGNTMRLYAEGLSKPELCYYAEITAYGKIGDFVYITAQMDPVDDFKWERTLLLKRNQYLLIIDEVTALRDMKSAELCNDFMILRDRADWQVYPTGEVGILVGKEYGEHAYFLSMPDPNEIELEEAGNDLLHSSQRLARFHLEYQALPKGRTIRLATLLRPGTAGERPATARQGDEIALRLPAPGLLKLGSRSFDLTVDSERLTRKEQKWELAENPEGAKAAARAESILAAKKPAAAVPAAAVAAPAPVWEAQLGAPVRLLGLAACGSAEYIAASTGKTLSLFDLKGTMLWRHDLAAEIGAMCFQESKSRLLVGCKDEQLLAFDLKSGERKWSFTSEMAPEMFKRGFYWQKSSYPGVYSLLLSSFSGSEKIYVGSAGTVEVLDAEGKYLNRSYIQYGPVTGLIEQPAADGREARILAVRSTGGWPFLFGMDKDGKVENLGMNRDTGDIDLGSFGFNAVGRMTVLAAALRPGGPLRLIGDLSGSQNRIGVWDPDGKILHDANLGAGINASTTLPYGEAVRGGRFFKGLALVDFDRDGVLEIVTVTKNRRLFIWSPEMKVQISVRLPASPRLLAGVPAAGCVVAGMEDGSILAVNGQGVITVTGRIPGPVTALEVLGTVVCAGDRDGNLALFKINPQGHANNP